MSIGPTFPNLQDLNHVDMKMKLYYLEVKIFIGRKKNSKILFKKPKSLMKLQDNLYGKQL